MAQAQTHSGRSRRRHFVAAVVLGTALSAIGSQSAVAARPSADQQAIQDISRYCTACWRNARLNPDCWPDCTQEVFSRLLRRIEPSEWSRVLGDEGEERREFLRAIDAVKKRILRSRKAAILPDSVGDGKGEEARALIETKNMVGEAAAQVLSSRQQQILALSFEGWSVHEIANRLQTNPQRVSDEKYKAVQKLRRHFHVDQDLG